jgi:hypothetical protein
MYEAWDESISTVCACARLAMNRCAAGLITRSWRPIRYYEGIVFHAGAVHFSCPAASVTGR